MATTTNYGWETPDDTDLVKDGALAQRTTASAIDTSLFNITAGKNVGLVPLNTTAFSATTSISINNVFSSVYSNYKILINLDSSASSGDILMRMRASGTDSSANYFESYIYTIPTSATVSHAGYQNTSSFYILGIATSSGMSDITLFNPNKTQSTWLRMDYAAQVGDTRQATGGGQHLVSTAYDGFSIISNAGNIAGTVRVYGIRNS